MQVKPLVAVVGRPNVGKSTFFNRVCGKRISIVKDTPGVTRDRLYADAEWCGYNFTLIDTGGIELKSEDKMFARIRAQAQAAIDIADVIVFFTDGRDGVTASDYDVAAILRTAKKPIVLVVNKLDNFEVDKTYDFYSLGLGEPFPLSCEQLKGMGEVLDAIVANFGERAEQEQSEAISIALVGKPNVGKSSLVNRLLGFERVIVSDVAGTTRDAIDTPFEYNGAAFTLIDTAGMRRKRAIEDESIEDYSVMRTIAAVRRADVVAVVMDASEEIAEQDVKIAGFVHEEGKPSVIVMNKWDLVEKDAYTMDEAKKKLAEKLSFMSYFSCVFVSAASGQRVDKIMDSAMKSYCNASRRISTGVLNEVVQEAVAANEPPSPSGRRLKILYASQPSSNPPHFVIFCNDETLVHFSYKRYLENALRRAFDFSGTPVKLTFRGKKEEA